MATSTSCSIIVPLFNKAELTESCVKSVIANSPAGSYELILIDNGSTDSTQQLCSTFPEDVVVIRNEVNRGFAKACNQGAMAATGDHLLFLNNDTLVHPGWLQPLIAQLDDPGVGAVGSKLLYPNGTIQHCGVVLVEDATDPNRFLAAHWSIGTPGDLELTNVVRQFQAVTAACALFRREAFDAVGGFDEGFWNGYEDVDLCLKLGERSWKVIYEPRSVVTHLESASGPERFRLVNQNVTRLMQRWGGRVILDILVGPTGEQSLNENGSLGDLVIGSDVIMGNDDSQTPDAPPILSEREALIERLEEDELKLALARRRNNRDVCWLEDADDSEPLVTVHISAGDQDKLIIERSLQSALNQTYHRIEILIVGDGCDEATIAAILAVDDPRVRFVNLTSRALYPPDPNHRQMVTRCHGMVTALDLARGTWITSCEGDDELSEDHVEVLLEEAREHRLEMVWSRARGENEPGEWSEVGNALLQSGEMKPGSVLYSLGLRDIVPNVRSWRLGESADQNLWRRMRSIGVQMAFVDHLTYIHHRRSASAGHTAKAMATA